MNNYQESKLLDISRQFQIYGDLLHAEPCKIGHINETYIATYNQGGVQVRYVHQRINTHVFKDPDALMDNFVRVTSHQRRKLNDTGARDASRRTLTVIPTRDNRPFYRNGDGECWRTLVFVDGVRTYEAVESPSQAFEAGKAFGEFQQLLVDLPGKRLVETIPQFHNTRRRFESLQQAIKADHANRATEAKKEIEFALKQEKIVDVILNALAKKKIPERITHNDTKFNNVMLDDTTSRAVCVIDLDTVMPGSALYDFGDMVRSATNSAAEDDPDASKVTMRMDIFEGLVAGYIASAGAFLNAAELAHLAFAGKLITYEIGLRFLTDHLEGDVYFKTKRQGHNLDRCRTQFALVASIERQEGEMQRLVERIMQTDAARNQSERGGA